MGIKLTRYFHGAKKNLIHLIADFSRHISESKTSDVSAARVCRDVEDCARDWEVVS